MRGASLGSPLRPMNVPGVVDVDTRERVREAVRVALAARLTVGDEIDPGALLVPDGEERGVVLGLLQVLGSHAPELARKGARRRPLREPLAVDQPVRLRVAPDDSRLEQPAAHPTPYSARAVGIETIARPTISWRSSAS